MGAVLVPNNRGHALSTSTHPRDGEKVHFGLHWRKTEYEGTSRFVHQHLLSQASRSPQ